SATGWTPTSSPAWRRACTPSSCSRASRPPRGSAASRSARTRSSTESTSCSTSRSRPAASSAPTPPAPPEVQSSRGARRPRRRLRRRTCLLRADPPRKPRANRNGSTRRRHKAPRRDRSTLVTAPATAAPPPPRRSLQGRGQPHRRFHIAAGQRSLLPLLESQLMTGGLVVGNHVDDVVDEVAAGGQKADLVVEPEGAHVHVRRPHHRIGVV